MATGQYLSEVAAALVERGHQVTVVTSRRAYDDPQTQFARHETWPGVQIYRVGSTAFGKANKWRRAADFGSFLVACCGRLATLPRFDVVVALTSPPLISFLGAWLARWRGSRFYYWVMDFNPDEAIAAGWLRADSLAGRLLERLSRFSLRRAHRIIALDRFMRDRIVAKGIASEKIAIIPPWSQDDHVHFDPVGRERFRAAHGLADKFVIMYSGNHSPCHSLNTLLAAARKLAPDPRYVFLFVGGGSEFKRISNLSVALESPPSNLLCLPYQPLTQLSASLSAADVQVVVMGEPFVGLIHPCKIYNILKVGSPVLAIGPRPSHLSELLDELASPVCTIVAHGDVDGCAGEIVRQAATLTRGEADRYAMMTIKFGKSKLLPRLVEELEK